MLKKFLPTMLALTLVLSVGCGNAPHDHDHDDDHGHHEHHAPHGGTLVVLGKEAAHLELVLEPASGELRAYSLDGEAEKAVPLKQPEIEVTVSGPKELRLKLKAQANELTGEKVGNSSEFLGADPALKNLSKFDGQLIQIDTLGQSFRSVSFKFPEGNE